MKKNVNDIQFNNDSHFNNDCQFNSDVQFINDSQFNNDSQLNNDSNFNNDSHINNYRHFLIKNDSNFNNDSQLNNNIQLSNSQDRDLNQCGSRDKVLIHRHLKFISQSVKSVNNPGDQNFIDLPTCISLNTIKVCNNYLPPCQAWIQVHIIVSACGINIWRGLALKKCHI